MIGQGNNDDRRTPITPQMAMRVAILGGIAFALFGIVFFRLWFLQVLSGDQYLAQASSNRTRSVVIQAPRGEITDRNGTPLVENRRAVDVMVTPSKLPADGPKRHAYLVRLSKILGLSTKPETCSTGPSATADNTPRMDLECRIDRGVFQIPYADVIAATDVSPAVYGYLAERADEFPGVSSEQVYLRSYPEKTVGAQLFGTVGQISGPELKQSHYRGVKGGTLVGQSGLEYSYDQYLRGVNGAQRIQVGADGRATGAQTTVQPKAGNDLRLSISAPLEAEGQRALATGIQLAQGNGNPADAGAFVALDPRNGQVLGMGSAPSFDPNTLPKLTTKQYDAEFPRTNETPSLNRALDGLYPVGSTFKVVTAAAAMAAGKITPSTIYDDSGTWRNGPQVRHNSGHAAYGPTDMLNAFRYSVDTYFYQLGQDLNVDPTTHPNGGALQSWARRFGFGSPVPIDVPQQSTSDGIVPSPAWRNNRNREQIACDADLARSQRDPHYKRHFRGVCAYSDGRTWSLGDNVSLAVGQGDFLATPLQMAVAYSAIENGGTIVKPHVGLQVTDSSGGILSTVPNGTVRRLDIPNLSAIQQGLHAAASEQGGTSADVWRGFPSKYQVYGKTGTAQHGLEQPDQAWYVCYIPDPVRPIVIAVTIERGGFGAQSAAPVARLIASQWFGVKKVVRAGSSDTL